VKVVLTTDGYDPWLEPEDVLLGRKLSGDPTWGCDGNHDSEFCDCDREGAAWKEGLSRSDPTLVHIVGHFPEKRRRFVTIQDVPPGAIYRIIRDKRVEKIKILNGDGWRIATADPEPVPEPKVIRHIRRMR